MQFLEEAARQEAKRWIEPRVLRGESAEEIGHSWCGSSNKWLSIQIGGWIRVESRGRDIKPGHVAVSLIGGVPCFYQFAIAELHREILRPDEVGVQTSLF